MLFKAIAGSEENKVPAPGDDFWYEGINAARQTASGVRVTPMSAMRASAVYACVKVLAETIASLPRNIYDRVDQDTIKQAFLHPLHDVVDLSPNTEQTAFEFWEMQIAFGALYGNSYAEIVSGARGAIDQLIPLRPDYMRVYRAVNQTLRFEYTDPYTGKRRIYLQEELFRIPGFSFNGVDGIAAIFFAQDPIGLALATEAFAAKFFSKDATPALVLEHPQALKPDAIKNIRASWARAHAGLGNAYSVAVLEEGMKVNALGVPNKNAQFLETRKHQISEVARYFRIPPHMIGDLDRSTNNNIEQQSLEFVTYTLRPWLRRIEQRVDKDLIVRNDRFFMKHELDDLLVGERLPRYNAWSSAINAGWITRNEVRKKENMNPLPGLDEPLKPLNMGDGKQQQAGSAGEGSQPDNPGNSDDAAARADVAYTAVLTDAFERIISAEVNGITALAKKYDGEARAAKVDEFYAKHSSYVAKALAPACALCASLNMNPPAAAEYAEKYTAFRAALVKAAEDPAAEIAEWSKDRASQMAAGFFTLEETHA